MSRKAGTRPQIGLAYARYVPELLARVPGAVDYIEIPYERLRHDATASKIIDTLPTILHCASLSIAGVVPARDDLITDVKHWAQRTQTPWIGEHLAFVTAPGEGEDIIDIGYTVAPPLNDSSLERVLSACARYEDALGCTLILENPPQYFITPGSTLSQFDFIAKMCEQSEMRLLLDLSHFLITADNLGLDAEQSLRALPLERVTEIHLSGVRHEMNTYWDDHGARAPEQAFALLRTALERATPSAITLEYNWSASFPVDLILNDLARIRQTIEKGLCA